MKVLHVLNELRPSGAETMLRLAAPYWKENGVGLTILSTGDEAGPYVKQLENAGFRIIHLPFRKQPKFFVMLLRVFREFDVVHIHTERGSFEYSFVSRIAGNRKTIRTIHNCFMFEGRIRSIRTFKRRFSALLGVRQISVGQSVYENELNRFNNRTHLIPNWFDESRFRPPTDEERRAAQSTLNLQIGQWSVLTVGNCAPAKNHEAVIRALAELPEAVYLHIGLEDDHRRERVLAEQLGVLDRVRFLGFTDPLPWLWAADVYAMPSAYEGFSIAAVEAVATGLPSILSKTPGLLDLENATPNVLFTDTKPEVLAESLCKARELSRLKSTAELSKKYGVRRGAEAYEALWR